jgi:hypothetical protein
MILQQVVEKLNRAITVPITSSLENVEVGDAADAEAVITSAEAALVAASAAELAAENAETSAAAAEASLAAVDATQIVSGTTKVTTNETPTKVKITTSGTLRATVDSDGVTLEAGASVNEFSTDGTLAGNSDDAVPTEKAVKTYVDTAGAAAPSGWEYVQGGVFTDLDNDPKKVITYTIAEGYVYKLFLQGVNKSAGGGSEVGTLYLDLNSTQKTLAADVAFSDNGRSRKPFAIEITLSYVATGTLLVGRVEGFMNFSNVGILAMKTFDALIELSEQVTSMSIYTGGSNQILTGRYFLYRTKH